MSGEVHEKRVLTEVKEAGVGGWRRVGVGALRAKEVSKQVWLRLLVCRGTGAHSEWVEKVIHCRIGTKQDILKPTSSSTIQEIMGNSHDR